MLNLLKNPYVLILLWVGFIAFYTSQGLGLEKAYVNDVSVYRPRKNIRLLMWVPLLLWVGFRSDNAGADTGLYRYLFNNLPDTISSIPSIWLEAKDPGFDAFGIVFKSIFGNNDVLYFLVIAAFQVYFLYKVYKKYSTNFVVSYFLFIASADYMAWMFNGMRQFLVATVLLGCVDLILEKKYLKIIIIILLLSTFHQSVLLVIPFIFICQGKAWNYKTFIVLIGVIFFITYLSEFTDVLDEILQETNYSGLTEQMKDDDGVNLIRVLVYSVPTILSFIFMGRIRRYGGPIINLAANMSIASAAFYIIGMFTSGILIGRIPIYFSLYNYILLPWIVENVFEKKSAKIIYFGMVSFYLLYYYFQMAIAWGYI